jgi:transcriptional regulator GlxA family with amidase domain
MSPDCPPPYIPLVYFYNTFIMAKRKIIFLILPHVHLLDLAGPDQVFNEAICMGAELDIVYCSAESTSFSSGLLNFAKLMPFQKIEVKEGDFIFIPGSDTRFLLSGTIKKEAEIFEWLRKAHANGAFLCSICTGAFFLAKSGLLNGKRCTTHWKLTERLKRLYPKINIVENQLFTKDERIFTSAGVTAGIDMSLFILGNITDDHFSFKIARELVVYMRRHGHEAQHSVFMNFRNHMHSGVHQVQDFIQDNINKKQSLDQFADMACMSSRSLTRIFKKETGITINEYITLIRKELLDKLRGNPDITRKQMAEICGLKSERQVIRLLNQVSI